MPFNDFLKNEMDAREISVTELSYRTRLSAGHLSRIIAGKRSPPKPATLKKIAVALGIPFDTMLKMAGIAADDAPRSGDLSNMPQIIAALRSNEPLIGKGEDETIANIIRAVLESKRKGE